MLVPVSEKFKGQNNWINTKNFLKYKGWLISTFLFN
jgi:hypothetical protein